MGYLYNDLKPDNICIGHYNDNKRLHQIKLIDFGLATKYMKTNQEGIDEHIPLTSKEF